MNATKETDRYSQLVGHDKAGPYLKGGKCASCEAVFFPRQSICPKCTEQNIEDAVLSRKGTLYTYTEVFQKPPDYEGPVPYMIGRVQLPEGVFILAQLDARKEDLRIGLEMELFVERIYRDDSNRDVWGYKFKPVGGQTRSD